MARGSIRGRKIEGGLAIKSKLFGEAALEAEYGRRIRLLREHFEMSKPEIAGRLGISEARYRRFEERGRMPAWFAPLLCAIYDVDVSRFLDFSLPFDSDQIGGFRQPVGIKEKSERRPFGALRSSR